MLPSCVFFFTGIRTPERYTLSLHDALPIFEPQDAAREQQQDERSGIQRRREDGLRRRERERHRARVCVRRRSEEHTSELQSPDHPVCRLPLATKNASPAWTCSSSRL